MIDRAPNDYALGHNHEELQRVIGQSRFLGELTEEVLRAAGIRQGMRVLDVGCGAGDVSFLAATLVGREGSVIGVDRSPEASRSPSAALATSVSPTSASSLKTCRISRPTRASTQSSELPSPRMIAHARIGTAADQAIFHQLASITRTLLPVMEKNGIASAAEVDVDTLAARLQRAVQTADATVVAPLFVGAWAHKPSG